MAITLRDTEKVIVEAKFNKSIYIFPILVWLFFGLLGLICLALPPGARFVFWLMEGFAPLFMLEAWIHVRTVKYIATNQRVYIEKGLISKSKNEIPLNKINDVSLRQGIIQRFCGTGTVLILTGNDTPTLISGIDKPDFFREKLSALITSRG